MPIYANGTYINNIKRSPYYIYEWTDMSSSEIQAAVRAGKLTAQTVGTSPYTYTVYTVVDTANYRVLEASYGSTRIQCLKPYSRDEVTTVLANGKTVYCKRSVRVLKTTPYYGWKYDCRMEVWFNEPLPFDVSIYFVFVNTNPTVGKVDYTKTLKAGSTYIDKAVHNVSGVAPTAWTGHVDLHSWYDGSKTIQLISSNPVDDDKTTWLH